MLISRRSRLLLTSVLAVFPLLLTGCASTPPAAQVNGSSIVVADIPEVPRDEYYASYKEKAALFLASQPQQALQLTIEKEEISTSSPAGSIATSYVFQQNPDGSYLSQSTDVPSGHKIIVLCFNPTGDDCYVKGGSGDVWTKTPPGPPPALNNLEDPEVSLLGNPWRMLEGTEWQDEIVYRMDAAAGIYSQQRGKDYWVMQITNDTVVSTRYWEDARIPFGDRQGNFIENSTITYVNPVDYETMYPDVRESAVQD